MNRDEALAYFAGRLDAVACRPLNWFAEKYGLTYGSVLDQVQGRVLPSRAMVVLLHAIENDPDWMHDVAKDAAGDLAILDSLRVKADRPQ
jgi:hypothetical protein